MQLDFYSLGFKDMAKAKQSFLETTKQDDTVHRVMRRGSFEHSSLSHVDRAANLGSLWVETALFSF